MAQNLIIRQSLVGSTCVLEFTRAQVKTGEKFSSFLARRSLVVMSGEAHYQWRYAIPCEKAIRIKDRSSRGASVYH